MDLNDDKLKQAYTEIKSIIKTLPEKGASSIRMLVDQVFPNLNEKEKARIMIFTGMLLSVEKMKNIEETSKTKDEVPSYIY
jgi:hypothetical protein